MASKRKGESDFTADNATTSKKFRAVIDESCEELLCAITYSLPLDPVVAEDGEALYPPSLDSACSCTLSLDSA